MNSETQALELAEKRKISSFLRKQKKQLLANIQEYDNGEFAIDDARQAIYHAWSIVARFEKEYENIPDDDAMFAALEKLDEDRDSGVASVEKYVATLEKTIERLKAKVDRVRVLVEMQRANKTLVSLMSDHQSVQESKKKQEFMEIAKHAQILTAFRDIFYLALRRKGFTDAEMKDVAKEMKYIERDYPVVKLGLQEVKKRLFGDIDDIIRPSQEVSNSPDMDDYNSIRSL